MATRDVFSADELAQLRRFPEIGRAELIRFFMLTPADEEFVRRSRDKKNVLGAVIWSPQVFVRDVHDVG